LLTWDAATGKEIRQTSVRDDDRNYGGPNARYTSLVLSPDGKYLAGGSNYGNSIRLWDRATGKVVCDFEGGRSDVHALVFSADGATVAVAGMDRTARVWNVHTGEQLHQVKFTNADLRSVAFAPDSKVLAVGATGWEPGANQQTSEVQIVRVAGGKEIARIKRVNAFLSALAFSPDGKVLAVAWQNQGVELWDAATGQERRRLEGQVGTVQTLAFSPDGRTLAAGLFVPFQAAIPGNPMPPGGNQASVALWELGSGQLRSRFSGHQGQVGCLAFSPDGRTLASGATDTTVLLWDMAGDASRSAAAPLPAGDLDALWADLLAPDAERGYAAIVKLRSSPAQALPLLRKHLRPAKVSGATAEQIEKLIEDLTSNRFQVREKAHKALEELGETAAEALRKALQNPRGNEQRHRIGRILEKLDKTVVSPEELRTTRALEALEQIGDGEARQLLTTLAEGAPHSRLTQEARAALRRLNSVR
jgi:dipeptidyl aminopeptidase/acylaminoacyl peptidase